MIDLQQFISEEDNRFRNDRNFLKTLHTHLAEEYPCIFDEDHPCQCALDYSCQKARAYVHNYATGFALGYDETMIHDIVTLMHNKEFVLKMIMQLLNVPESEQASLAEKVAAQSND